MATTLAILQAFVALAGAVGVFFKWKAANEARQDGRNEVTAATNAKTVETQDAMDRVSRPSDDDVAGSLHSGKF